MAIAIFSFTQILSAQQHFSNPEKKVSVPFDYSHKEIIVETYIDGKGPFSFMIDTGIYPSMISLDVAKELGIKLGRSGGNVLGIAGSENHPYYPINLDDVAVGGYKVESLKAISAEMSHFSNEEFHLDGVLGHSFLKDLITRIDYSGETVEFSVIQSEEFLEGKSEGHDYLSIPLELAGGRIPVLKNVFIKGKRITAWLDTGSSAVLTLSGSTRRALDMSDNIVEGAAAIVTGTRGSFELDVAIIDVVSIGSFQRDSVQTILFSNGGQNLLGNPFFENYILTMDYINDRVYLER